MSIGRSHLCGALPAGRMNRVRVPRRALLWSAARRKPSGGNAVRLIAGSLALASGLVLSSLCAAPAARAADPFVLKSPTLADNAPLPAKDAGNNKQNPNCVGDNISPPLAWSDPPEG